MYLRKVAKNIARTVFLAEPALLEVCSDMWCPDILINGSYSHIKVYA